MNLEAVYYSAPAPTSLRALTVLGLVFDRLIFPGVHVPDRGVDLGQTAEEFERIQALPHQRGPDTVHLLNLMLLALNAKHLKDFCIFTGNAETLDNNEPGTGQLAHELHLEIYGPPPENFIPEISACFSKGLPGDERACINSPSWLFYPANALLYAGRTGTVLVNDNPYLPMPSVGGVDLKANATQLATIMALESVKFVLPSIKPLSFCELAEFRFETKDLVQPFRRAMLKLSKDLNAAILSDTTLADVRREAKFIVESTVAPELEQMKEELARPARPWYRRVVDLAAAAPEIAGAFATMPKSLAVAKTLAKAVGILADVRDGQLEKEGIGKRGGFHYLLRVDGLGPDQGA